MHILGEYVLICTKHEVQTREWESCAQAMTMMPMPMTTPMTHQMSQKKKKKKNAMQCNFPRSKVFISQQKQSIIQQVFKNFNSMLNFLHTNPLL